MGFIEDKAYILHRCKYKETSLLNYLFTFKHGHIQAILKGAYTNNKVKHANLPFTLLNIRYTESRYKYKYLSDIEPIDKPHCFTGNKLSCVLYLHELLIYSLPLQHPYQILFRFYQQLLPELEQVPVDSIDVKLRSFEIRLLSLLGYHYSFDQTCEGKPINKNQAYQFIPGHGFTEVTNHNRHKTSSFMGNILSDIADKNYTADTTRRYAKQIMRMAIKHLIGNKELKSRKLFITRP